MTNLVRMTRETRGLSVEELAALTGVSTRYLIALEEDQCSVSVEAAIKIAKTLQKTVEELFDPPTNASIVKKNDEEANTSVGGDSDFEKNKREEVHEGQVSREKNTTHKRENVVSEEKKNKSVAEVGDCRPVDSEKNDDENFENLCDGEKTGINQKKKGKKNDKKELVKVAPYVTTLTDKSLVELVEEEKMAEPGSLFPTDQALGRRVYAPRKSQKFSSPFSKTAQMEGLASNPKDLVDPTTDRAIRFFDLFCGIGGFRYAAQAVLAQMNRQGQCVFSCDIDDYAKMSYAANFGETPFGDVSTLASNDIPDFDILFAGFPCQTFSIIGLRKGFEDETKGSLFFQVARIIKDKRPLAFVLENVRQLTTHDNGRTFEIVLRVLQEELGYYVDWRVLNALECGVPQKRERVVVVGARKPFDMEWPTVVSNGKTLAELLEKDENVDRKYFASPEIAKKRKEKHTSDFFPAIWHENKSGIVSSYPYSCALRAGASYNYLLVNGVRRLTPREMLRLQGFPDDFKIVVSDSQIRKQAGNAAPVCLIQRALERFLPLIFKYNDAEK